MGFFLPWADYELLSSFLLYFNTVGINKHTTLLPGHMIRLGVVNHAHYNILHLLLLDAWSLKMAQSGDYGENHKHEGAFQEMRRRWVWNGTIYREARH